MLVAARCEEEAPHEGDERTGLSPPHPPASAPSWLPERSTLLAAVERGLQRRQLGWSLGSRTTTPVRLDASASPYIPPPPSSPTAPLPRCAQLWRWLPSDQHQWSLFSRLAYQLVFLREVLPLPGHTHTIRERSVWLPCMWPLISYSPHLFPIPALT
jgi:hypothetical protein